MIEDNLWTFVCPHCGSMDRVTQQVADQEKERGNLSKDIIYGASHLTEIKVLDPKHNYKPGERGAVLICFHDFCAKCGTNYCFRITLTEVKFSMNLDNLIKVPPAIYPKWNKGN
jgi:hypothetical protein